MADVTRQRRAEAEMRLDMTIGSHALDLVLPRALLKIDVMPDGEVTIMAFTETGVSVKGDPGTCMTIGPADDW